MPEDYEEIEIPANPNELSITQIDIVVGRPPIQMTAEVWIDASDPAKAQAKIRELIRIFTQAIPPNAIEKWEQMVRHRKRKDETCPTSSEQTTNGAKSPTSPEASFSILTAIKKLFGMLWSRSSTRNSNSSAG